MFATPRRFASLSAAATISATASVQVTVPVAPTLSAIVSEGSPGPPATSSTDCPSLMLASAMSASVSGANIDRIVARCLSQYGADSRHCRKVTLARVGFINLPQLPVYQLAPNEQSIACFHGLLLLPLRQVVIKTKRPPLVKGSLLPNKRAP